MQKSRPAQSGFYLYGVMENIGLFEKYVAAADIAVTFGQLGVDADDFMRCLQLEWESYADEPSKTALKSEFYHHMRAYTKYRNRKGNWRDSFDGRDFNDLLV